MTATKVALYGEAGPRAHWPFDTSLVASHGWDDPGVDFHSHHALLGKGQGEAAERKSLGYWLPPLHTADMVTDTLTWKLPVGRRRKGVLRPGHACLAYRAKVRQQGGGIGSFRIFRIFQRLLKAH